MLRLNPSLVFIAECLDILDIIYIIEERAGKPAKADF
jgi:hypothetical protein